MQHGSHATHWVDLYHQEEKDLNFITYMEASKAVDVMDQDAALTHLFHQGFIKQASIFQNIVWSQTAHMIYEFSSHGHDFISQQSVPW